VCTTTTATTTTTTTTTATTSGTRIKKAVSFKKPRDLKLFG
jgi:hypothetical protein